MFVKLENDGRLRLPSSIVEMLSLREGALLDCRTDQRIIFLMPVKHCNTDDFSPGRGPLYLMLWLLCPVLERKPCSHSRQKGHGNPGVFVC